MKNGWVSRPRYAPHGTLIYLKWDQWRPLPWRTPWTSRADAKPHCIPCRNDGWHTVSSTSTQTAWCEGICASCYQGSQQTRGLQELDPQEEKQSSWRRSDHTFCMVDAMQAWPHNEQNQVAQGQVEPPRQKANLQNELFWDLCTCCDMVRN